MSEPEIIPKWQRDVPWCVETCPRHNSLICDLTTSSTIMRACNPAIRRMTQRLEDAQAIVTRLEKTHDGVSLAPEDHCWVVCEDQCGEEPPFVSEAIYMDQGAWDEGSGWHYHILNGNGSEGYDILSAWSTSEAAEQAKERKA